MLVCCSAPSVLHPERRQLLKFARTLQQNRNTWWDEGTEVMREMWGKIHGFDILEPPYKSDSETVMEVGNPDVPTCCPHCGARGPMHRHSTRYQFCMDIPKDGLPVKLRIKRIRYKCVSCSKTFWERIDHTVDRKRHKCTKLLVNYIKKKAITSNFVDVAKQVGLDEKTVRGIFRDHANSLNKPLEQYSPSWIGLEAIEVNQHTRCAVTDITNCKLLDILPDTNANTLVSYLNSFQGNLSRIKYVSMNIHHLWREAIRTVLPHANVIVSTNSIRDIMDRAVLAVLNSNSQSREGESKWNWSHGKFVIVRSVHGLRLVEHIGETIQPASNGNPQGTVWYQCLMPESFIEPSLLDAAHSFYNICSTGNRTFFLQRYQTWQSELSTYQKAVFSEVLSTIDQWNKEILLSNTYHPPSQYPKLIDRIIHSLDQTTRGYSFDAQRLQVLSSFNE